MSTSSAKMQSIDARPRRHRALRIIAVLATVAAVLVIVLLLAAYWAVHRPLPQLDGTVKIAGLRAPVQVIRDHEGVPHITASSLQDLLFAQGYVTAQDRLWQMDIERRWAAGELAEVAGPSMLSHDRRQRILGVRAAMQRAIGTLSPRELEHLNAYARGVNAYIQTRPLPLEFRAMGYRPRPWAPVDSLLCFAVIRENMSGDMFKSLLSHEAILAKLGPELTADLFPYTSWRDHPPGQDEKSGAENPPSATLKAVTPAENVAGPMLAREFSAWEASIAGSNDWAISGQHTVTGKPLLANDTHNAITIPSLWYEAQLTIHGADASAPEAERDFDVAGFTQPGVPFVQIGHNQRIAWGYTNLHPRAEDIYVEEVNGNHEYKGESGWLPFSYRRERIRVKGRPDVQLEVAVTRHGPVITPLLNGESRTIAFKWTMDLPTHAFSFYDLDTARNWNEFREALSRFGGPSGNFVYADVDGHIGYQAAGAIPLRRSDSELPLSGTDPRNEWTTGFIPLDQLPSVYDPPSGIVATSNGRITPDHYPYVLTGQWSPPYRTQRVYQLLSSGRKFSARDMLAMQMDTYSAYDHFLAQQIAAAVAKTPGASARAQQAAKILGAWDGYIRLDSSAPTLVETCDEALLRILLVPKLGASNGASHGDDDEAGLDQGWRVYKWSQVSVAIENIVRNRPPRWLPAEFSNYDQMLTAAVEKAVARKDAPADLNSWTWGKVFTIQLAHPVFGHIRFFGRFVNSPNAGVAGDTYTVKQVRPEIAPSMRMTVDLADFDNSTENIVTGQSGQIFSPHYMDQFSAWLNGTPVPFRFSEAAVAHGKAHELTLEP